MSDDQKAQCKTVSAERLAMEREHEAKISAHERVFQNALEEQAKRAAEEKYRERRLQLVCALVGNSGIKGADWSAFWNSADAILAAEPPMPEKKEPL